MDDKSWSAMWRGVIPPLLSVHFLITVLIVSFWFVAVLQSLTGLSAGYAALLHADQQQAKQAGAAIKVITDTAIAVSGLFTTVIGLVLGYYFGQRGQENAERALKGTQQQTGEILRDVEGKKQKLVEEEQKRRVAADEIDQLVEQAKKLVSKAAADAATDG